MPAPTTDTDGGLFDGVKNVLEALGLGGASASASDSESRAEDVIDTTAEVIADAPAPAAPAPPPAGPPGPAVESRRDNGRAFMPSELAEPLYRFAAGLEALNRDMSTARAADRLSDRLALAWAGWRGEVLGWAQQLEAGAWSREDPAGDIAAVVRRQAKLPRWRQLLEQESGQRAQHSRADVCTATGTGRMGQAATTVASKAAGLPLGWKVAIGVGLAWGAVKVVPSLIDAIMEPFSSGGSSSSGNGGG